MILHLFQWLIHLGVKLTIENFENQTVILDKMQLLTGLFFHAIIAIVVEPQN